MDAEIAARFDRLEGFLVRLMDAVQELTHRVGNLEQRMDGLEQRMDAQESATQSLRTELEERFITVTDQFRTQAARSERFETRMEARFEQFETRMEARFEQFETRMETRLSLFEADVDARLAPLPAQFASIDARFQVVDRRLASLEHQGERTLEHLERIDVALDHLNGRLDGLGDDMRQRFRAVNDRLANVA